MEKRTSGAKSGVLFSGCMHLVHEARMPVRIISLTIFALSLVAIASGQDDAVRAAHATIQKIDSTGRTIVVKTDDGSATHCTYSIAPLFMVQTPGTLPPKIPGMA
jgi:hypothetical protein